ncbi:MAG: tRNA 2-thiouridine(34) synthase MnmA [Thermodesulfovibrionales bacterium]|nr:tRNA 2-thiouridine(34) synthase MnmA [Thermodesulfovibrionales bacterium]
MDKVIVGMSGGVDSSTAAYLLKQKGYEVEGVSFILYQTGHIKGRSVQAGCCSIESIKEAALVAAEIGIPHSIIDLREEFLNKVINPFIDSYKKGLTPNPCILCNKYIKFPFLLRIATERKAPFIATGHYAKVINSRLLKGRDQKKDQSYVLYVLKKEELERLILPLGELTKEQVREIARTLNLAALRRPESQEICFIEDRRYSEFLINLIEPEEGPIIDIKTGEILKTHRGLFNYTIGQRRGLGISSKEPYYVVKIDPENNTLYVGKREDAFRREIIVNDLNILQPSVLSLPSLRATVKIRSTMKDEPATVYFEGSSARVIFDRPQWAPAPGQSAVFYEGELVIGGGVIKEVKD